MKICKNAGVFTFGYPVGAGSFSLASPITGITINAETGEITINWSTFVLGVYKVVINYIVAGVNLSTIYDLTAVDCTPKIVSTVYTLCNRTANYTYQVLLSDGSTYTNFTIDPAVTGVTISSAGLLTINPNTISAIQSVTIKYGTYSQTITVNKATCETPTVMNIEECALDPIGISWINQQGGRQSFYFNQPKEFAISQKGGDTFVNSDTEKRYYTKGVIEDVVRITEQLIPIEFVTSINSLKNAIQAWVFTDIDDVSTYQSIIIDEDTWTFRQTKQRFYELSFTFKYSIAKVIQKQ